MKHQLEQFLNSINNVRVIVSNHRQLVAHFGFFISEVLAEPTITAAKIRACYDAASISSPRNIHNVMAQSKAFIKTKGGWQLHRNIKADIAASIQQSSNLATTETTEVSKVADEFGKEKNVVVVYGRDEALRDSLFQFLRSLRLNPLEWNEAIRLTGQGSPYTGDALQALFNFAQVIIVLFTPDEYVELRPDLRGYDDTQELVGWQPRPNVLIEAGMALAKNEAQTIIVQIGNIRKISDLEGRHFVFLDNSAEKRNALAQRLRTAGCQVETVGSDWLRVGNFQVSVEALRRVMRKAR